MNLTKATRRSFLKNSFIAGAAAAVPAFIPARVLASCSPSNRISVGCIGVGRMGLADLKETIAFDDVQITAVCDVDSNRADYAKNLVENYYRNKAENDGYSGCRVYTDYRELIARSDIDAVLIATPDHWHALPAVEAARAGKDIFLQKPLTYSLQEGRLLSDTVRRSGCVFQVGTQQRSDGFFRRACELVRNGRIGLLQTIDIGMELDISTDPQPAMPVPPNLDYEMWLGPAPWAPYTEKRVHPQKDYSRPGWLRISDYCLGMISGWGAHQLDIAHWAMDMEYSGPVEICGEADFPQDGIWNVHESYKVSYVYSNGVTVTVTDGKQTPLGVRFNGSEGWIHVWRGRITAEPKSLLTTRLSPDENHLYKSANHKRNFLDCIKTRRTTIAPVEVGHRSCSACILGYIALKTAQTLKWDPVAERILNSETASRMLARQNRSPWSF